IESYSVHQVTTAERIRALSPYVKKVHVSEDVAQYMVDLIRRTRDQKQLRLGPSPRALIQLSKACKAKAILEGRSYVIPDDVKNLIWPTLNHRIWLTREAELEEINSADIIARVVNETAIPGLREIGSTT